MNWKSYKFKYMFAEFSFRKNPYNGFHSHSQIFLYLVMHSGPGSVVGAGRSSDRIPVGARFSTPV